MTPRVATDEATPMLQMRGIDKRFPGVIANDNVDFDVRAGEVHALIGENGAGKSTLMKILFGLYRPDRGEVLLHGKPLRLRSPHDAIEAGVGMIHQHFMLVPTLTVTENVALGLGRNPLAGVDLPGIARRLTELSNTYHLGIDPDAMCWQLAVGERQRVEILKVLYRRARLLVLDEPTAVLTPAEVGELLRTLRRIAADGCGLVFISHKLHETLEFADRITVMRDGAVTGEVLPAETSIEELAQLMVGRPVKLVPDKAPNVPGAAVLAVSNLTVAGNRRPLAVDAVTLEVHAGEVVGIAGVSGNGQRELADAIAGLLTVVSGTVRINDVDTTNNSPRDSRAAGLAYVPEERMRDGAIGTFSVWENLILLNHAESPNASRWFLQMRAIRDRAQKLVSSYTVKTPSLDTPARSLSGGNIQKMIMAREMSAATALLVVSQPTRGVDIGAAEYIHARLLAACTAGVGVLLISEDLEEVLGMSDRIGVMFEGRLVAMLDRSDCTPERLGLLMAGGSGGERGPSL
ncbi:MAG: ABC transporter ATP-binding protein [Ilumatobacteraceae bacterium]